MSKILGLDLGTHSIGWALIDSEKNEIINMGCKIFEHPIKVSRSRKISFRGLGEEGVQILKNTDNALVFFLRDKVISILCILQIITLFLLLLNIHNWQFWFGLSFTVLIGILSAIHGNQKCK